VNSEAIGRTVQIHWGGERLTDLELLAEIARLKRSVARFGGAGLRAAYRAVVARRGLKCDRGTTHRRLAGRQTTIAHFRQMGAQRKRSRLKHFCAIPFFANGIFSGWGY